MTTVVRIEGEMPTNPVTLLGPPLRNFMTAVTLDAQAEVVKESPTDTGRMRQNYGTRIDPQAIPEYGQVVNNVHYTPFQDRGTGTFAGKARHFPPAAALERWAYLHGILDSRGRGAGFIVARAIARRGGLRPKRFISTGWNRTLSKLDRFLQRMVSDIEKAWR